MIDARAFDDCRDCLCQTARSVARDATSIFDRQLQAHGLHITQFTILANLILRGTIALSALAEAMGVDRTTMTRNVCPMTETGWVKIRPDENDARMRLISITPSGRRIAEAALPAWRAAQETVTASLGAGDVAALHRLAKAMPG